MKNNKRIYLDIHALQILPPSNINRDDTGSPKTAQYGGVRRARVSSQSWKKAMRDYFYENSCQSNVGVRTLEIVRFISDKIRKIDNSIDENRAIELTNEVLKNVGIKTTKDNKVKALFFIGDVQAENLAKAAINKNMDKDELKRIMKDNPAIDIALFGRMVADDPKLNEDASSQVSHAISTHGIQNEFDFYTAIDDLSPSENSGAGMLGTMEFNSSILYRYANVAVHELVKQVGNNKNTVETLKLFIESFSNSMPTGKINSFANQTLPYTLVVCIREDRPINLVTAYEEPVKSNNGYLEKSVEKLGKEFSRAEKFSKKPILTMFVTLDHEKYLDKIGEEKESLSKLLEDFDSKINEILYSYEGE